MVRLAALLVGIALAQIHDTQGAADHFGRYIGPLSRLEHSVSGEVYAVDARTLHIRDFIYDGEGPAAFFYAGSSKAVGPGGFFIRDEQGSNGVLKKYNKKHITLTLPEGKTLHSIKWFSVWCEEFQVNFGDIQIPRGLDFPKPQKIGSLKGVHKVTSDNIVVVDAQTLLIPSFSYDGEAPDAKFWVGRGPKPSPQGIRVPDENGKTDPLRRYDRKTIVLTLPGELTVFDIGHFGVWCEAFTVDFGHVQIPPALNVPPSLKMLGVSPQKRSPALQQYLSQQQQQQEPQIGYENVISLFNSQEIIRPTTFRPPLAHRFAAPLARSLFQRGNGQKSGGVQIQSALSLTPEPIVFTQIGDQPLQRVYTSQIPGPDYSQRQEEAQTPSNYGQRQEKPQSTANYEQQQNQQPNYGQPQQQVLVQQQYQPINQLQRYPEPSQIQEVPGFLLQPSVSFIQPSISLPVAQINIPQTQQRVQPPSQYLQIPNSAVPQINYNTIQESLSPPQPLFYQRPPLLTTSSNLIYQSPNLIQRSPHYGEPKESLQYLPRPSPLQDLPNPYHELAARRSYEQQEQRTQHRF
ncbi:hypothetical protein GE061_015483 [Apolygus lucorum]|uniref:DM13 domain-containing protein n=1 Tax=Apolygus lucorum TaxID=248454 RepID=A0A8S9XMA2_APOLU|nr:hypothetical protein GE061_015483 [Apolygus lucorum]